jgi:hypothetical protein
MTLLKWLIKAVILPLVIVFNWDALPAPGTGVVIQGVRVKGSPTAGGPYAKVYAQTTDATATSTTDGSLTSGETRCYISVSYGLVNGIAAESATSGEVCKTNTTDAPLSGPIPGGTGNLPATR